MQDLTDIRAVQKVRPDLTNNQADEVLGFLNDVYDDKPYTVDNNRLFKAATDLMFPLEEK